MLRAGALERQPGLRHPFSLIRSEPFTHTASDYPARPGLPQKPGVRCFHGREQLREFASNLDVLVCLLPLTDETR